MNATKHRTDVEQTSSN